MKKIAIKYDKDNWTEIKKAVDLLRENGYNVKKRKHDNIGEWTEYLENYDDLERFEYVNYANDDSLILTMPQDMQKLKEALGVDMPNHGEKKFSGLRINMAFIDDLKNINIGLYVDKIKIKELEEENEKIL